MIVDGLLRAGEAETAQAIVRSSLELIALSGPAKYYDPLSGESDGDGEFTRTAAMVLEFLQGGTRDAA